MSDRERNNLNKIVFLCTFLKSYSLFFKELCEQMAQAAYGKRATVSDLLRSLTKNEQMSELLVFLSESLIRSFFRKKQAIRTENR